MKRAIYLLTILILVPFGIAFAESQRFNKWKFESKTDAFTDEISFTIQSEVRRGFHLTLACADERPFLMMSSLFADTVLFSKVTQTDFRVDSKPAVSFEGIGVNSIIAFSSTNDSSSLVDYFRGGEKLMLRAEDFRGQRVTDTVSLSGFDEALAHFANYCQFQ
ncbi:MAG: invasion associated locus B family protein [Candidatus Puniceispirillaceae bacterium]